MSLDEINKVDLVAKSPEGKIAFVAVDHRKWSEISNAYNKVLAKLASYKEYLDSNAFKKEYGNKEYEILLMTPEEPPEQIKGLLESLSAKWKKTA